MIIPMVLCDSSSGCLEGIGFLLIAYAFKAMCMLWGAS